MLTLGSLALTTPWLLAALAVLPALFWLLRVTPPAPRLVRFPAISLLLGLAPREETPARTPLWLILLRLAIAALLIVALAHPLLNPAPTLGRTGPLLLAVDDGWAAGARWPERQALMESLVRQAVREDRRVVLVTTAPVPGEGETRPSLMRAADALGTIQALKPRSWAPDRLAAARRLAGLDVADANVVWLSDGIDGPGAAELGTALARLGALRVVSDPVEERAHLLLPAGGDSSEIAVTLKRAVAASAQNLMVRASGEDGRLLARAPLQFAPQSLTAQAKLALPAALQNEATRVDVEGESSAGTTVLLDERWRRRPVGIAGAGAGIGIGGQTEQPLLSTTYYLDRALEPFTDISRGMPADLLKQPLAMIVVPDGVSLTQGEREALGRWVEAGGVLLRFAGPHLVEERDLGLLPVTLRQGDRALGGALSWAQPAHLAPFPPSSPFAGLAIPGDVTITRQVLAEPSLDLDAKTWARLADGTPLVTAERRGQGQLVLVHTTANSDWSNLALSGLFVDMLRRLVGIGAGVAGGPTGLALAPLQILDGGGHLGAPPASARPIQGGAFARTSVDGTHPPGFYGTGDARSALNLAQSVTELRPIRNLPPGATQDSYRAGEEIDLRPWLLGLALGLALIDLAIGYALRGLFTRSRPRLRAGSAVTGAAAILLVLCTGAAQAQAPGGTRVAGADDARASQATSELHLAFVRTGNDAVDAESRAGLVGLTATLNARTSVDAAEPLEIDLDTDELAFFPLLYWPVTPGQPALSDHATAKLNQFMATGGTIVFDTRDAAEQSFGEGDGAQRLRALVGGLNVPPLIPVPPDHVLTKAFYLLQDFPGRFAASQVWVERPEDRVNDGVSTIIIGASDWAGAWSTGQDQAPLYPCVPGGERQREMAYRVGINLVMYALTGNYKADQVHVPSILERLGQ